MYLSQTLWYSKLAKNIYTVPQMGKAVYKSAVYKYDLFAGIIQTNIMQPFLRLS